MRTTLLLVVLLVGCGPVTITGTVSLAPGYTAAPPSKCEDIEVSASNRFLDSENELATTRATGDISTGHCEFKLEGVPSGGSVFVGSPPYREAFLYYTDNPEGRYTLIDSQYIDLTIPRSLTLDLVMDPPQPRPPL
ncbi:MAG TPA: hypothetical protein VMV81_01650 [Phycisphaerae bacterium]|nr:hypothetical protein [Phycisphaerae bacterium]